MRLDLGRNLLVLVLVTLACTTRKQGETFVGLLLLLLQQLFPKKIYQLHRVIKN